MGILKYISKRLLTVMPVLIGVTLFSFILGQLAPGNPEEQALMSIGIEIPTKEQLFEQREKMGLNDPIFVQYGRWLEGVFNGDLGESYFSGTPILEQFSRRLPITLKLSIYAGILTIVFGIGSGVIMAINQNKFIDKFFRAISIVFLSMPGFVLAIILIIIFSENLGILPTSGNGGFKHFIMPAIVLSAGNIAMTSRVTRSVLLSELGEQYVTVAISKGISEKKSAVKHALKNSLLPIISMIGNYLAGILGGSTIVESIFSLNGIGSYMLSAISSRDYIVVQGYVLYAGTIYVVATLLIDIAYLIIDPKLRLEGK